MNPLPSIWLPSIEVFHLKAKEANTMTYHFCKIIIGHICCRWNTIKYSKNDERRRGDKAHKLDVNSTIEPSLASTLLWPQSSDIILLTLILLLRLWFTSIVQTEMICPSCFLSNQDLNIFQISPETASYAAWKGHFTNVKQLIGDHGWSLSAYNLFFLILVIIFLLLHFPVNEEFRMY